MMDSVRVCSLRCVCDTGSCTLALLMAKYRLFFRHDSSHFERFFGPAVLRQRLLLINVENKVQALRSLQLNSLSMWFSRIDLSIEVGGTLKCFSDLCFCDAFQMSRQSTYARGVQK